MADSDAIVHLNVGGTKFSTSRQTLTWIADSFFTSLLSSRIPTLRDENGAIFIDRDPQLFRKILNYLRTKQIDLQDVNIDALKHEAQYYGLAPLVKRLVLCSELDQCACGDVLFHGYLTPPPFPVSCQTAGSSNPVQNGQPYPDCKTTGTNPAVRKACASSSSYHSRNLSEPPILPSFNDRSALQNGVSRLAGHNLNASSMGAKPRMPGAEPKLAAMTSAPKSTASATSSLPHNVVTYSAAVVRPSHSAAGRGHNRASSADFKHWKPTHRSRGSTDLTRMLKHELSNALKYQQDMFSDPYRVHMIRGHHNWIAVAYSHYIACYRMKDSVGWQLTYVSQRTDSSVRHIALNAKTTGAGGTVAEKLLAVALTDLTIYLYSINEEGLANQLGAFSLSVAVDSLFFIGGQLVALSKVGKVGIWHGMTQNWQVQDVLGPIASYDTAGSFLLLGCANGSIYYIDMQKFPLRMKDNDLLVTELYRDPASDAITSISVYLTPKSSLCGNWIEIAYGTSAGIVRVIVQHPETVGHSPQLFQTFAVHRAPITNVALTTNHLISVCSEYNHVRSWTVTRFRGMISTQPGSTPLASFKVLTLESADGLCGSGYFGGDVGPFGDQDGDQVFVQKIVPDTDQLYVRLASNGERVCVVKSVDGTGISAYLVHECEGSSRMGARPRRYLFTGHSNGSIQMWDLSTALEVHQTNREKAGAIVLQGPTPNELLQLIDECEITCNSLCSTPGGTPAGSTPHLPSAFATNGNGYSSLWAYN